MLSRFSFNRPSSGILKWWYQVLIAQQWMLNLSLYLSSYIYIYIYGKLTVLEHYELSTGDVLYTTIKLEQTGEVKLCNNPSASARHWITVSLGGENYTSNTIVYQWKPWDAFWGIAIKRREKVRFTEWKNFIGQRPGSNSLISKLQQIIHMGEICWWEK